MKYNVGDTLIKNNRAYIVLGEGSVGKDKFYYLQTRSGSLVLRSEQQLNRLIVKLGYELHLQLCNPKYPSMNDFRIGDLIVGRRQNEETGKYEKQSGIILNIRRRKRWWYDKKSTKVFVIAWSNGEHKDHFWSQIEYLFVPLRWHKVSTYHKWKHLPIVK